MARIKTSLGVLAFGASTFALACGDGESDKSELRSVAGATATAGNTSVDGSTTGGRSSTATGPTGGGTSPATGTTGGSTSVGGGTAGGGTSVGGGTAGAGTTVGGGTAGAGTSVGGGTAGTTSTAVGGTAGNTSTAVGGSTAGGTHPLSTGTAAVAGTTATGGQTGGGGAAPTGGVTSTGGVTTTGGTSALSCVTSFFTPTSAQSLSNADDLNADCSNGIQFNVSAATNAPNGTAATLSVTTSTGAKTQIASTTVSGATASFSNATLPASGQVTLTVDVGGTACSASESVTLNCAGAPACTITSPTITAAHPALNNVPIAQGGDRRSSAGSAYQVVFKVSTDVQDGQPVSLLIDGATTLQATASAGMATFDGVYMIPDGAHTAQATCTAKSGITGSTTAMNYPVDTAAPNLTPQKGKGADGGTITALANGDHYDVADDADATTAGLQIKLCGLTDSTDAIDIPAGNPSQVNFCASVGGNAAVCSPATSANSGVACVNIDCPGKTPFSVDLSLKDVAGNSATATRTGITCASSNPSVTFIDPISDTSPFSDITKRILATGNAGATRKDKTVGTPGAQYDVVACTDSALGTTAVLSAGYMGQTLNQLASTTVVSNANSICSTGNLLTFSNVTLPESLTNSSFNLSTATELKIAVTDLDLGVGTATADVWVDSTTPSLNLVSPTGFCGKYFNTSGTGSLFATVNMTFASSIPVTVSVSSQSGTNAFTGSTVTFAQVAVNSVQLEAGSDTVSAQSIKPSSNYGSFGPCDVTVGDTPPPTVSWQTPVSTSLLTAAGNTNPNAIIDNSATSGWQGTLKVCSDIDATANPTTSVQFTATVAGTPTILGSATIAADAGCPKSSATLSDVTVPEGASVLLTATTSQIAGNSGVASITVPVSSTVPGQPGISRVDITDRRLTSFTPVWNAPSGSPPTGYKVRVSKSPIASQTDFDAARDIPYAGSGSCPTEGCSILVLGCYIENDYYFAVAAVDFNGNQGPFNATTTATTARFNRTVLTSTLTGQRFGRVVDGSGDLNGDGFADLVVSHGEGKDVYIYFGSAGGLSTTPLNIQGSTQYFGYSIAIVGDVNRDGLVDLAIGSPNEGDGAVYLYYGRSTWTVPTLPDVAIKLDSSATGDPKFLYSAVGWVLSRLGDFNGDGTDDFVLGTPFYNGSDGHLAIVLGKQGGLPSTITLPGAFGTDAIEIKGSAGSMLGWSTLGLGHFYGSGANTTLIASAIGVGSGTGALLAFRGPSGNPSSIDVSTRNHYVAGASGAYLGEEGLFVVGDFGPSGQHVIGVPVPRINSPGRVDLYSGSSVAGPFEQNAVLTSAQSGSSKDFGELVIGSAYSGVDAVGSFIGNSVADLVVGSKVGGVPQIFIVDGTTITLPSTPTAQGAAQVVVNLPTPWTDFSNYSSAIADINKDGYADIAVGQTDYTSTPTDGSVVVYY